MEEGFAAVPVRAGIIYLQTLNTKRQEAKIYKSEPLPGDNPIARPISNEARRAELLPLVTPVFVRRKFLNDPIVSRIRGVCEELYDEFTPETWTRLKARISRERDVALPAIEWMSCSEFADISATLLSELTSPPEEFVPNTFQQNIMTALEGKALKKQQLADLVCGGEGTRLYRDGGIKELMALGLVKNKPRLGYYRPDKRPSA